VVKYQSSKHQLAVQLLSELTGNPECNFTIISWRVCVSLTIEMTDQHRYERSEIEYLKDSDGERMPEMLLWHEDDGLLWAVELRWTDRVQLRVHPEQLVALVICSHDTSLWWHGTRWDDHKWMTELTFLVLLDTTIRHFGDVLPNQSLSTIETKSNATKAHTVTHK